jgi:hypothetical protein
MLFKIGSLRADNHNGMTRAGLFILIIGGLALSGWTLYQKDFQAHRGGTVKLVHGRDLAYIELTAAGTTESSAKALVGTYSETNLRAFKDMRVVYANETVFCLEVHKGGGTYHVAGPGGSPADGPC